MISRKAIFYLFFPLAALFSCAAHGAAPGMTVKVYLPDPWVAAVTGERAVVYLDGQVEIDTPAKVLATLVVQGVHGGQVYLNSPGGNLFAGMELGRLLRKEGFDTTVGKEGSAKYDSQPGGCYSACVLAYLGGYFRYSKKGSQLGVHRFSTPISKSTDLDTAQITSAAITNYLGINRGQIPIFLAKN